MKRIRVRGFVYRLAQDPEEVLTDDISSDDMVQDLEKEPGENWKEYLQPIIVSIRSEFGLPENSVTLLSPKVQDLYGAPSYGFSIVGHVKYIPVPNEVLEKYGQAPYKFKATITPNGDLISAIDITGSKPREDTLLLK